jgi:organic radical activating enzyme
MKKTLRLIYTPICNRSCPGCCNKDFDLPNLPRPDHFNYEEIFITGGEPLLFLDEVIGFIKALRLITKAKIYIYTAFIAMDNPTILLKAIKVSDGITLTIHEKRDWIHFLQFENVTKNRIDLFDGKSLRLNIFKEVEANVSLISDKWKVKNNIEWIVNCPLPPNEVLMKVY